MVATGGKIARGLRGATAKKEKARGLKSAKDVIKLNQDHRLFFKLIKDEESGEYINDIVAADMWGRKLDNDVFKRSFFPIPETEESRASGMRPTDESGIAPYQRICRLLFDTEYKLALKEVEEQAEKAASMTGQAVDKDNIKENQKKIKLQYEGDIDNNIYPKKSPIIGRIDLLIATECWVVPLDAKGQPEWKSSGIISFDLGSKKKRNQLCQLLDNADYCRVEDGYLEVGYNYQGQTRNAAGQAASFQGIAESLSLSHKFPSDWEAFKENIDNISATADDMTQKNFQMNADITAETIVKKVKQYISTKPLLLPSIDLESDNCKYCAKDLLDSGLVDGMNIQNQLIAMVNAANANQPEEDTSEVVDGGNVEALMSASTIKEIAEAAEGNEGIIADMDVL